MVLERAIFAFLTKLLLVVRSRLRSRQAEILVLRQQVLIFKPQVSLASMAAESQWGDILAIDRRHYPVGIALA